MFALLAQQPIVVDLAKQPQPTQDISIYVVLGMFAMAGIFLLVALVGCAIVAGGMILYKRRQDAVAPAEAQHSHIRLQI